MRLHQSWRNYVSQLLLQRDLPVVTDLTRRWLVGLHVDFFVEHAETDGEKRRDHLNALFDATMDVYLRALEEGFPEAQAREITHIQGTWAFQNQGWGELVEFPPDEREAYHERYADFFDRYGCSPDDPLGEFAPAGGLPDAPATPERMHGDYPFAAPDLTDGVYIVAENTEARCGGGRSSAF
ncbi:DUF6149 family protein [Halorubrum gandharaense]